MSAATVNVASADVTAERLTQAMNSDRPTLVMFFMADDPVCVGEKGIFDEVSDAMAGKAHFLAVNAAVDFAIKDKYDVRDYPTFLVFRDGQEVWRATGRISGRELEDMLFRFV